MGRKYYVYIMANKSNIVLYTGVTNDLRRRIYEHKEEMGGVFTKKYKVNKLVWFQVFENPYDAITGEKQIKAGSRQKKLDIISSLNSDWKDLYDEL